MITPAAALFVEGSNCAFLRSSDNAIYGLGSRRVTELAAPFGCRVIRLLAGFFAVE